MILLFLCSCAKNQNKMNFDPQCFESFSFYAEVNSTRYKGTAEFKNDTLGITVKEPAEIENMLFQIDSSGIRCSEEGVECSYIQNDFNDSFIFYDLYCLIVKARGCADFEKSGDGFKFPDDDDVMLFDKDGKPLSAEINKNTLIFT